MSDNEEEKTGKVYLKCPEWDGTTPAFKWFKIKFPAYLDVKNLKDVLIKDPPKDSEVKPINKKLQEKEQKAQRDVNKMKANNNLAVQILMNCIDITTTVGQLAFGTIQLTMDPSEGQTQGNIKLAWHRLTQIHDARDTSNLVTEVEEYNQHQPHTA